MPPTYQNYSLGESYYAMPQEQQMTPLNPTQLQQQQQQQYTPVNPQTGTNVQSQLASPILSGTVQYGVHQAMAPAATSLPSQPVVVGATPVANGAASGAAASGVADSGVTVGTSTAGSMAGGLGAAALMAGHNWAAGEMNKRPQLQQNAYAYVNNVNPYSWYTEGTEAANRARSGEDLDTDTQIALTLPTLGSVWWYNPLFSRGGLFGSMSNPRARNRQRWQGYFDDILGQGRTFTNSKGQPVAIEDYHLDPEKNNIHAEAIAIMDPVGDAMAQGDKEQREDVVALMAKAVSQGAYSRGDVVNNALALIRSLGYTAGQIRDQLKANYQAGLLTRDRVLVYANSMAQLTDRKPREEYSYITGA